MVTDDKTPKPKKNSAFELVTKEEKRSKTARVQSAKKRIEIPELIKQVLNNIKPFEFPTSSKSGKRKSFLSKEKTQTFYQPEKTSTTFFIQKLRKTSRLEAHLHSLTTKLHRALSPRSKRSLLSPGVRLMSQSIKLRKRMSQRAREIRAPLFTSCPLPKGLLSGLDLDEWQAEAT